MRLAARATVSRSPNCSRSRRCTCAAPTLPCNRNTRPVTAATVPKNGYTAMHMHQWTSIRSFASECLRRPSPSSRSAPSCGGTVTQTFVKMVMALFRVPRSASLPTDRVSDSRSPSATTILGLRVSRENEIRGVLKPLESNALTETDLMFALHAAVASIWTIGTMTSSREMPPCPTM